MHRPKDANVNGTIEFELWYTHDSIASLMGYCDAYQAGNSNDIKNTSGGCFLLGNNLVSWLKKIKISYPSPQQKQSILLLVAAVCSNYS